MERALASILVDGQKRAEAFEHYGRSIDLLRKLEEESGGVPDNRYQLSDTLTQMANLLRARGDVARAAEHYREALALKEGLVAGFPDVAVYAAELAWFLADSADPHFRDPARAVRLAQRAVAESPKNGDFWNTLGMAQYRQGQWRAAVASLEKSNQLRQQRDEGNWLFLAMAHWRLGEKRAARACYDRAVELLQAFEYPPESDRRWRAEAAALLGIKRQPPGKATKP
jgi:tetratricopeptide (TPR) repeat protein